MQSAAIYFHRDGFDTTTGRLLGRQAAGESFLRGYLRHAALDRLDLWNVAGAPQDVLEALVQVNAGDRELPIRWIAQGDRAALGDPGVVQIPGPAIGQEAWRRRTVGARAYSICGVTHTTATPRVMDLIASLLLDPTEAYDALVCTSSAVRASVEAQLDGVRDYLRAEFGPRVRGEPQRVTIPLGVNADDFAVTAADRGAWRERLGIPADGVVALFVGRFNVREKMNPGLMAIALEQAAQATGRPIFWVNSGWAETAEAGEIYHREAQGLCPSVTYLHIDGRDPAVRYSIWSVADFFISFSDNIQETFGLTPVEAMAAGLPCVVTDWNGYKDTVRHGEDGFRIPTLAPAPGEGADLAQWLACEWISYTQYVGATAQYTAIDYAEAVAAISILVTNADYRRRLGANAQARARAVFDWKAIIPQYQALWADLDARRRACAPEPFNPENPFRPDPYRLFGGYPTAHLTDNHQIALPPGVSARDAESALATPMAVYSALNRPTPAELQQTLTWLADGGGGPVADLLRNFPAARRRFVRRGLLWIARQGVLSIRPPE